MVTHPVKTHYTNKNIKWISYKIKHSVEKYNNNNQLFEREINLSLCQEH